MVSMYKKAFHHIDVYEVYKSIAFNSLQYIKVIVVKKFTIKLEALEDIKHPQ